MANSASGSQPIIDFPTAESRSPVQMFGIRYGCASTGLGSLETDMSRRTSWTGAFCANSFCCSLLQYSKMSLNDIPDFCMYGTVIPQLW